MGIIRKGLSMGSLGAIDWRSDKERIAAHAKGTKHAVKDQTKVLRKEGKRNRRALQRDYYSAGPQTPPPSSPPPPPASPPPGWYSDPQRGFGQRWWDGTAWTEHEQG